MTFQEAMEFKVSHYKNRNPFKTYGNVYVTPSDPDDFDRYTDAFVSRRFDDHMAQAYCTNDEYSVRDLSLIGRAVASTTLAE
jgi:hypothetical protein